jgi:hypothetical protein
MNDSPSTSRSCYWAIALVELSLLIFLAWQFSLVWRQRSVLAEQKKQRQQLVDEAVRAQAGLNQLIVGVYDLARTDPEARAILEGLERQGIRYTPPTGP